MSRSLFLLLAVSFFTSCYIVPKGSRPEVTLDATAASQFNFRGMVNVDRPVVQTELATTLPTKAENGFLTVRGWANWDLTNDVGNAWFPPGHAGEPSQIDMSASYTENYRGFDVTGGIISYALQNPDDFPFAAERGETKEVFVDVARLVWWELVPSLTVHYDFDEVKGWYINAALSRAWPINEKWDTDARVSLAYAHKNQSNWLYGIPTAGLADAQARARVSYFLDENSTIHASVNASTIVDSEISDWFDVINIDSNNVWATIGVTWAY